MNEEMDNNSTIRIAVDSVPVRKTDSPDDSPQLCLSEGNKHFIHKRFTSAISAYSLGLKREEGSPERKPSQEKSNNGDHENNLKNSTVLLDLLCNRALTYIAIGKYSAAVEDTRRALLLSPEHFKANIRHAKALAGLNQYQEAIEFVEEFLKVCKNNGESYTSEERKELQNYFEKLKWKKRQSETGDFYDAPSIMDKPFEPAPEDWVEYIGQVEVKNIEGKGRGLVAAEDLPPAKLIVASRAFEIIFLDGKKNPEKLVSEESGKALEGGKFKVEEDVTLNLLARKVYDKLEKYPERRADFYQLHAGNDLGHVEPSEDSEFPPLDMTRIYGICRTNTFANSGDSYPEIEKSVGIWLFPAFVNHQCVGGNCTWKIFGDFIFLRTYKSVKKGEELTHSYVSPAYPLKIRTELLTTRLGFVCNCTLCELDRKLPQSVHDEKAKLKQLALNQEVKFSQLEIPQNSEDYTKNVQASILLLEIIITKLEKIQPDHGQYNASLHDPLQKLGLKYFGIGEFQKTAKIMERTVSLLKSCMLPHAVADCTMWIVAAYLQMGNEKQAKKWGKVLKDNLLLAYGDIQVLRVLGPWVLEPMKMWGMI